MHKPRQEIPKCIAKMHQIKEVAEVQNFGQAELQSSRLEEQADMTQQTTTTP